MSTLDLINVALDAKEAYDTAYAAVGQAAAQVQTCLQALQTANQNLHDDLASGGACCVIDDTTTPPTVTVYTAADPDSYTATPIRVAA